MYVLFILIIIGFLIRARNELVQNQSSTIQKSNRPLLLRSLFTLGLLCKHFDFENDLKPQNNVSIYSGNREWAIAMSCSAKGLCDINDMQCKRLSRIWNGLNVE